MHGRFGWRLLFLDIECELQLLYMVVLDLGRVTDPAITQSEFRVFLRFNSLLYKVRWLLVLGVRWYCLLLGISVGGQLLAAAE